MLNLLAHLKDVCNTVQAAHQAGYLHLDLKPDNVMVEPSGATFVVDWGLAQSYSTDKVVMPVHSPGEPASEPGILSVVGTPEFMAPEQIGGRSAEYDARTDVFALSGILHMILTGNPPRVCASESKGTRFWSVFRKAALTEFTDTEYKVHGKAIPRELVSICEQGLALLPEERYASAAEFRNDIERWERGEIVAAHRHKYGRMERVSRWVARHVQLVVPAALATMILVLSLVLLNWQQSRIAQHRADADRQKMARNTATEVALGSLQNQLMAVQNEDLLRRPELIPLRLDLLQSAWRQYDKWAASAVENRELMIQVVKQLHRISQAFDESISEQALLKISGDTRVSEAAIERATEVCRRLLSLSEEKTEARLLLATSYRLGATLDANRGNADAAMFKAELAEETLTGTKDANLEAILESLRTQRLIAAIQFGRAMSSETNELRRDFLLKAAEMTERSLEVANRLLDFDHTLSYERAMIESQAAIINHKLGRLDEAVAHYQQALGRLDRNQIPTPTDGRFDSDWVRTTRLHARILNNYGLTLRGTRGSQAALDSHKYARDLRAKIIELFPWLLDVRSDLAQSYGNIADTLVDFDDSAAEIAARREAAQLLQRMFEDYPSIPGIKEFWALHRVRTIAALHRDGADEQAALEFVETVAVCPVPELAEPTNSGHLMDVALGHCLALRISKTPDAHRQAAVNLILRIHEMTDFTDTSNRRRLLTDSAFEWLHNVDVIKPIVERIRQ